MIKANEPPAAKELLGCRVHPMSRFIVDGEEATGYNVEGVGEERALGVVGVVCRVDVPYIGRVAGDEEPHPSPRWSVHPEVVG